MRKQGQKLKKFNGTIHFINTVALNRWLRMFAVAVVKCQDKKSAIQLTAHMTNVIYRLTVEK